MPSSSGTTALPPMLSSEANEDTNSHDDHAVSSPISTGEGSVDEEPALPPPLHLSSTDSWYQREYADASTTEHQAVVSVGTSSGPKDRGDEESNTPLPAPLNLTSTDSWYEREYGDLTSKSEDADDVRNVTRETAVDNSSDEARSREDLAPWLGHGRDTDDLIESDDSEYYSDEFSEDSSLTTEDDNSGPIALRHHHTSVMAIGIYDASTITMDCNSHTQEEKQKDEDVGTQNDNRGDDDEHSTDDIVREAVSGAVAEQFAAEEHDEKHQRKEEEALAAVAASVARRPSTFMTPEKKKENFERGDGKPSSVMPNEHLSPGTSLSGASLAVAASGTVEDSTINVGVEVGQEDQTDHDLEAQAGIPVAIPGAYAVEGMDAPDDGRQVTGYDSGFEDDDTSEGDDEQSINGSSSGDSETTLIFRGEVHRGINDHVLVDGLPVFDDEGESSLDDAKRYSKQTKLVLLAAAVVITGVIVTIIVILVGDSSSSASSDSGQQGDEGLVLLGEPLLGPDGNDEARFGHSVSIALNGTFLAVGLPRWDEGDGIARNLSVGQVHVYAFDPTTASYVDFGLPMNGPGPGAEAGKAVSLSRDGRRLAVASPSWRGGIVTLYDAPASPVEPWESKGVPLTGEEGENGDFGFDVDQSADGRFLVVGSPSANAGAGVVRIYELQESWTQLGDDLAGRDQDFAGYSVAMSADGMRVVTGAIGTSLSRPGRVQAHFFNGTAWEIMGDPIDGESAQDRFGHSVALSSDGLTLAIGASGGISAGHFAQIFQYREEINTWVQLGRTLSSDEATDDFGFSVSLSADGNTVGIGSPSSDHSGGDSGKVSVFHFDGVDWTPLVGDISGDEGDSFGYAVSLSWDGRRIAGGSPMADLDGRPNDVGKVVVYELVNA